MLTRPIATVEPETITERPACCIVSTIASSVVSPCAHLLPEPEDHQQRVVDRDTEPDERDEELDDDRDVGDVGQGPDAEERRQDRGHGGDQRHQDRRQRPEDEEQDDERADGTEQRLGEHARAVRAALGIEDRVDAGEVGGHPEGVEAAIAFRVSSIGTADVKLETPAGWISATLSCGRRRRESGPCRRTTSSRGIPC